MTRVIPDFLIVGAAKSGTTSLFEYLSHHPSIYIPSIKECRFFSGMPRNFKGGVAAKFANEGPRAWGDYQKLFHGFEDHVCGDISNDYLFYYEKSIANIRKYLGPQISIVIVLRNPVERAYSHYLHAVRLGSESEDFGTAIAMEDRREAENYVWSMLYRRAGLSASATEAYLSSFKRVRVYLYEEIFNDVALADLQDFIGVNALKLAMPQKANVAQQHVPRSRVLNRMIGKLRAARNGKGLTSKVPTPVKRLFRTGLDRLSEVNAGEAAIMPAAVRRELLRTFDSDICRLEALLNRDLSEWRKE